MGATEEEKDSRCGRSAALQLALGAWAAGLLEDAAGQTDGGPQLLSASAAASVHHISQRPPARICLDSGSAPLPHPQACCCDVPVSTLATCLCPPGPLPACAPGCPWRSSAASSASSRTRRTA